MNLLKEDLANFSAFWEAENEPSFTRYHDFVMSTGDCCLRTHTAGHCTGSALITDPKRERVLLLFHPFLQRWLQPGGHADGSQDLLDVARREAHEETGLAMDALHPLPLCPQQPLKRIPFDLDIHLIPARPAKSEAEHYHYDLRYLFVTDPNLELRSESPEMLLEWLELDAVFERTDEESVLRMIRKLRSLQI